MFLSILKEHTAGDPIDETKKWTNLTCAKIGSLLAEEGFKVSRNIVRKLLKKNDFVKRKALKKKASGGHVNRIAQFGRTLTCALYIRLWAILSSAWIAKKGTDRQSVSRFACIFNRVYETGRKVAEGFKESMRIVFDKHLGQWNYVAMPDATIL